MADAADSKSATRKGVKVRLLSPAPSVGARHAVPEAAQNGFGRSEVHWFSPACPRKAILLEIASAKPLFTLFESV